MVIREESAHELRSEYCIAVTGEVRVRPEGNANAAIPTGEIEVDAQTVEVLNPAATVAVPARRPGHGR